MVLIETLDFNRYKYRNEIIQLKDCVAAPYRPYESIRAETAYKNISYYVYFYNIFVMKIIFFCFFFFICVMFLVFFNIDHCFFT